MKIGKRGSLAPRVLTALGAAVLATMAAAGTVESGDPLAREVSRWSQLLRESTSKDETWLQIKGASEPLIAGAQQALRDGRRLLALQRLASARAYLAAASYVGSRPASQVKDVRGLEAEWTRMGGVLRDSLGKPDPGALNGVSPAAARALGEAALSQVRVYYDSSLEYGRNTIPEQGLFYLGLAGAQRDFVSFCRALSPAVRPTPPPLRSLEPELESLEGELLDAYRPPASIDKHAEFIAASSMLKEARELDAAGLRYGALLRYLQAAQRVSLLRGTVAPLARRGACHAAAGARRAPFRGRSRRFDRKIVPGVGAGRDRGRGSRGGRSGRGGDRRRRASPLLRRARARSARRPEAGARGHGDARPLAVHLKSLRSGKFAGRERRSRLQRQGAIRFGKLRRVGAREALRRDLLSRDLRRRRARRHAEGLLQHGPEGGAANTFRSRPPKATSVFGRICRG